MSRQFVVVIGCIALVTASVTMTVQGQSQPTAADLYRQGKTLYEAGDLEAARQTLRRADPFQLSREDRLAYYKLLAAISRGEGPTGQAVTPDQTSQPLEVAQASQQAMDQADGQRVGGVQEVTGAPVSEPVAGIANEEPISAANQDNANTTTGITEIESIPTVNPNVQPPTSATTPTTPSSATTTAAVTSNDVLTRNRQLHAQQKVAEAERAKNNGNYALATRLYEQALAFDPNNAQIRSLRDQAMAMSGSGGTAGTNVPQNSLQANVSSRSLDQQAAQAEFVAALNEARRLMEAGNYGLAQKEAERARQIIERQRAALFNPAEARELQTQADQLIAQIQADAKAAEARRAAEADDRQKQEAAGARELAKRQQAEEIDALLRRAMDLKKQREYDEALELVNQVLFLDPNNVAGELLQEVIINDRFYQEVKKAETARDRSYAEEQLYTFEQTMMQVETVKYPDDWPELTRRRLLDLDDTGGESEVNRRVELALREPIPADFENNQLSSVIEFLRNSTGQNFFVNWSALEAVGVEQDAPVTLKLNNVPAERVLRLVLSQVSANDLDPVGFSVIEGIVTISTLRDLQRSTEIRNYDIRDLLVQVPNFSEAPAFDLSNVLDSETGGGGGGGGAGLFDTDDTVDSEQTEQLLTDIMELIRDSIGDPLGWADRGGDVSSLRELSGNLIVKTTPENHRSLISLLAQLRETRAVQISVEARFLLVQQDFMEQIGIDLDIAIAGGQTLNNGFDADGNPLPINFNQDSIGLGSAGNNPLTPDRFNVTDTAFEPALDFGLSYTPYFIDDLTLSLFVTATQANSESINLTAPRITFFNGQRAYVLVARQIAFVSDLEPVPDALSFDPTLSVVQSGVVLDVQGTISSDRRYVTMTVRPSLATLATNPIRSIPIPLAGADLEIITTGDIDVETTQGFIEAPELELTQIRATVSVPDRGTLLLGGQKLVQEIEYEAGVPILSKIPVISRFFSNSSIVRDERTLLVLVKPTIIIQTELEDELFPGLNDDPAGFNLTNIRQ